jgi:hypothetical protein
VVCTWRGMVDSRTKFYSQHRQWAGCTTSSAAVSRVSCVCKIDTGGARAEKRDHLRCKKAHGNRTMHMQNMHYDFTVHKKKEALQHARQKASEARGKLKIAILSPRR